MPRIPVALQLFSVREQCEEDLPATLEAVADMGYGGVEFAGYYGRSAEELRSMLDDLGLQVAGTHTGLNTLLGDELERTIEFNKVLGNSHLVVPALPRQRRDSREALIESARIFSELVPRVAPHGMKVGYHNHHWEFSEIDGEMGWDIFFGAASREVIMQVDTGNALHGGADPVPFIERYPGRATTVHLKDYSEEGGWVVIGKGDVRWEDLFHACETVGGTEWYIVEQESHKWSPLETVARCLESLEEMGR